MNWVSEWDTVMRTNLSSVLSSCNLKRKESFNEESGTKRGIGRREEGKRKKEGKRRERRKENEKGRRGGRRKREREGSSNLSISDQLQGGVLVDTKRVRAEVSCNKHRHNKVVTLKRVIWSSCTHFLCHNQSFPTPHDPK